MKIKNFEIEQSVEVINKILSSKLSVVTFFNLKKDTDEITKILNSLKDARQKIIDEYCDKDEEGKPVIKDNKYIFTDNQEKFNEEFNELMNVENDINIIKFDIEEFKNVELSNIDEFNRISYLLKE